MSQLILVTGPPCSGKSTLAAELGIIFGSMVLDVDQIRQIVIPTSQQTKEDRDIAYRCMHLVAEKLLDANVNRIILTATYSRSEPRQWLRSMAEKKAANTYIIACKVDAETAVSRFHSRTPGHAAIDLTGDSVRRQVVEYRYGAANAVDCTVPLQESVSMAEHYLRVGTPTNLAEWSSQGATTA